MAGSTSHLRKNVTNWNSSSAAITCEFCRYTQVVITSVYFYFIAALFGRQFLVPLEEHIDHDIFIHMNFTSISLEQPYNSFTPDMKMPLFTIMEFIAYMGWIKVADSLLNPFGDDDEDFDVNYIINRNLKVSYRIVDDHTVPPMLEDDGIWDVIQNVSCLSCSFIINPYL